LPGRIGALEDEQREIASRLEEPALYRTDPRAANALSARLAGIDGKLTALLERRDELER
jgi:ATP-binding cassette subfamily F protein uup